MSESTENSVTAPVHGHLLQAGRINAERIVLNMNGQERLPVPRMLRADPLYFEFYNRTAELAKLDELWAEAREQSMPLAVVISGIPGVGKTTTMCRWAHTMQGSFPDGTLLLDLNATAPGGPATPYDLLGVLLRQLGVEVGALPPSEAERGGLLQSLLADRSVLMLLDDAATSRQVLPLLPPSPTSCVLITTRHPLDLVTSERVRELKLGLFDEEAAIQLLSGGLRPSSDDHAALRKLAKACGRLPLALRLAGGRLRNRPSIASFTERLLSRSNLLSELHADGRRMMLELFDACYNDLSEEHARVYRAFGLHPGTECSAATVAALLDVPTADAEEALEELSRGDLLEHVVDDRFRMHDLLHQHAADKARASDPPEQRAAALRRMIDRYHEFAIARDHVLSRRWRLSEDRYQQVPAADMDRAQALREMEAEHANLLGAVRTAVELGMRDRVWQLCEALFPYQYDRGLHEDLRAVNDLGIVAAEELVADGVAAQPVLARMLIQHASGSFAAHDNAEALTQFRRARAVAVACGDARQEQSATEWEGFLHERAGNLRTALECYDGSRQIVLECFPEQRQSRPLALYGMHAGRALVGLHRDREAEPLLLSAVATFTELGERGNIAKCEIPLATAELRIRGDIDSAWQRANRAMESIVELRIHAWRLDALELVASLHEHGGAPERADEALREAVELAVVLGDPRADRYREAVRRPE